MPKEVIFETEQAIFRFELSDAIERLRYYSNEHRVREATEILEKISSSPLKETGIANPFFAYIVLDLLRQGKGSIFCKACQKTYSPEKLRFITTGAGKNPFSVKFKKEGGFLKRIFRRKEKRKMLCLRGGEGYECPSGHKLISMITWTGQFQVKSKSIDPE